MAMQEYNDIRPQWYALFVRLNSKVFIRGGSVTFWSVPILSQRVTVVQLTFNLIFKILLYVLNCGDFFYIIFNYHTCECEFQIMPMDWCREWPMWNSKKYKVDDIFTAPIANSYQNMENHYFLSSHVSRFNKYWCFSVFETHTHVDVPVLLLCLPKLN